MRGPEHLLKELRARAILLEANKLLVEHLEHLVRFGNEDRQLLRGRVEPQLHYRFSLMASCASTVPSGGHQRHDQPLDASGAHPAAGALEQDRRRDVDSEADLGQQGGGAAGDDVGELADARERQIVQLVAGEPISWLTIARAVCSLMPYIAIPVNWPVMPMMVVTSWVVQVPLASASLPASTSELELLLEHVARGGDERLEMLCLRDRPGRGHQGLLDLGSHDGLHLHPRCLLIRLGRAPT